MHYEFFTNINFQYYPEKTNIVADVLSHRLYPTVNSLLALSRDLYEDFKKLELNMVTRDIRTILYTMGV